MKKTPPSKQHFFQVRIDADVFLRARARKRSELDSWRRVTTLLLDAYAEHGLAPFLPEKKKTI